MMPIAWRLMGTGKYDALISSHHAFGHTSRLASEGIHLAYVHAPARYVWTPEIDERGAGWYMAPARAALRRVDRRASRRVDGYAVISNEVAKRVQRFWNREATVLNPPVPVEYFSPDGYPPPTRDYVLGVGRWIPYKNLHLVVAAASRAGLPVKIAGRGPDRSRIVAEAARATVPVELIESPSDDELRDLYRNAAALVFPTVEDFGLVPVEAQASGTPVVALGRAGALETVVAGESGVLTDSVEIEELATALSIAVDLDPAACVRSAARFSTAEFRRKILQWVGSWGITPEWAGRSS
jgi:glycosyltransferase involved in cell wall biosynthesis